MENPLPVTTFCGVCVMWIGALILIGAIIAKYMYDACMYLGSPDLYALVFAWLFIGFIAIAIVSLWEMFDVFDMEYFL